MTIPKLASRSRSPAPDVAGSPGAYALRPALSRTSTHDSYANGRDESPARRLTRVPTDSSVISSRNNLRPVRQQNAFADDYEDDEYTGSGSNSRREDRHLAPIDRLRVVAMSCREQRAGLRTMAVLRPVENGHLLLHLQGQRSHRHHLRQ